MRGLLALGFLLLGCESLPEKSALADSLWEAVTLHGKPVIQTRRPLTIEFRPDGRLGGHSGVNSYGAAYKARGNRIAIEGGFMTTMIGTLNAEVGNQETAFLRALGQMRSCFIGGEDQLLRLCDSEGKELATLKRISR